MSLDVRLPMGALFTILGAMVMVYGLVNSYPIDVHWGAAMTLFGVVCSAPALTAMHAKRKAVAIAPATEHEKG